MPADMTESLIEVAKFSAAIVTGGFVTAFINWMASRGKVKVDVQALEINASTELRDYVKGMFEKEREQNLVERAAHFRDSEHLMRRIQDLELTKASDETTRREMVERELKLMRELAVVTAAQIVSEATITNQRTEIERLTQTVESMKGELQSLREIKGVDTK